MSSAKLQIIFTSIFALTSANTSAGIEQFSGVSKRVKNTDTLQSMSSNHTVPANEKQCYKIVLNHIYSQ